MDHPQQNSILRRWEEVCRERNNEVAVWGADGRAVGTFGEIRGRGHAWADQLALEDGQLVVLRGSNSADWIAALLGIWEAGKGAVLVDWQMPMEAIADLLAGLGVGLFLEEVAGGRLTLRRSLCDQPPLVDRFSFSKIDLVKLTSGTSSEPRAVLFTAKQLEADCDQICRTMGFGTEDRNYGLVSFSHSYGFSNLVTPLLCHGTSIVAASDVMPEAIWRGLRATRATVFPSVPVVFRALGSWGMARGVRSRDLPDLRLCISAGAPLRVEVARCFFEQFGHRIHGFYGASECGGICYDREGVLDFAPGFVGEPLEGVILEAANGGRLRIDNGWRAGKCEATDDGSRIIVQSDAVGLGYWPPGPNDLFSTGQFSPSDRLVYCNSTGRTVLDHAASSALCLPQSFGAQVSPLSSTFLASGWYIIGRDSEMINVGGRKVNAREIQAVLCGHEAIKEAVVVGKSSALRGEEIVAYVVLNWAVEESVLRVHCAERLASWMLPKRFVFLDVIPMNNRGKVDWKGLAGK